MIEAFRIFRKNLMGQVEFIRERKRIAGNEEYWDKLDAQEDAVFAVIWATDATIKELEG